MRVTSPWDRSMKLTRLRPDSMSIEFLTVHFRCSDATDTIGRR